MQRISRYIISLALLLPLLCNAQDTVRYPINEMKGIRIGVDFSKFLLPIIYKGERTGFEGIADMHIKGNLFAAAEAGWLSVNLDRAEYHYRQNGIYGRLGIDYNMLKSKVPNSNDIVYVGMRYGFSRFNQQAENVTVPGYYWTGVQDQVIPKSSMNAQWIEFLLGVKAEVLKNFYVGINLRLKFTAVSPKNRFSTPYMIPGYGSGSANYAIGINYCMSYNIHF